MRAINFVATLAALGIFGYFVYKVIVPKLGDLQLPTFQSLQPPPPQRPAPVQQPVAPPTYQQPQSPAPAITMPDKVPLPTAILPDPEKPKPPKIEKQPPTKSTKTEEQKPKAQPQQPAAAPSGGGNVLYDSNRDGKWNNGQRRVVTESEGNQSPNGKGMQTAATGNPTFTIDGNGIGHLSGNGGHPRVYIYANNYNARLEGEFMFEKISNPEDDISIKIRSRHGHKPDKHPVGGSGCPCGGIGTSYGADGTIKPKAEICHPGGPKMGSGKVAAFQTGRWHKFAFSVWDEGGAIKSKTELDGKVVAPGDWPNPSASCKTKSLFDTDSYFWLRLNPAGAGQAAFRNIRLTSISSASANTATVRKLMIDEPYLYNGFYHGRRL